jgi:hypothetical protein
VCDLGFSRELRVGLRLCVCGKVNNSFVIGGVYNWFVMKEGFCHGLLIIWTWVFFVLHPHLFVILVMFKFDVQLILGAYKGNTFTIFT